MMMVVVDEEADVECRSVTAMLYFQPSHHKLYSHTTVLYVR